MKTNLQKTILKGLLAFLLVFSFTSVKAQTLAGWTFDTTAIAPSTPTTLLANLGAQTTTASLYANGTNGSSTWVTATTGNELNMFGGSTINDPRAIPVAGSSYCPVGGTTTSANGKSIVFKLSTLGFENPILTYATRNTTTGFQTQQWAWSTDGTSFTDITPAIISITTTFGLRTINLSAINAVDNATDVYLRLTVSGATAATGNNRIDNVFINASVLAGLSSPTVTTTSPATLVTSTSATLAGNVTNTGGSAVAATGIVYAETSLVSNPTIGVLNVTNLATLTPNAAVGTFSEAASGLTPNTQYSFRAYATNTQGTSYGSAATFYTLANVPNSAVVGNPTASTIDVSIGSGDGNPFATTEYAIQVDGGQYVQASGSLGALAVWQTASSWATVTVTGLLSTTTYSFAVKARNGNTTETAFSSSVTETTLVNASATLSLVGANPIFGSACISTTASLSFSFDAVNLNSTDLTIGALTGFTFSLSEFGSYSSTLTITNAATSISGQVVWVKFSPTVVQSYDGNISITGGGLVAPFLVATIGEGISIPASLLTGTVTSITSISAQISGIFIPECSEVSSYGFEISTISGFANGTGTAVVSTNEVSGSYTATVLGLNPNTTYYFKSVATDATGIIYTTQSSFTTANLEAPVATAATAIQDVSFVANWNAVAGATSYILDVSDSPTFGTLVPASNLIISEYGEGNGGNKKYIEIYNGTGASVDLANYQIWKNVNGSNWNFNSSNTTATLPLSLTGTLANGATYVIANNATDVIGANLYSTFLGFNGDDATGLAYNGGLGTTYTLIDAVGVAGTGDPGAGWPVAGITDATVNKILIRKDTVLAPNTNWTTSAGTSVADSEWIVSSFTYDATNQTTNLGLHTMNNGVASYLPVYENLSVTGTSQIVTGLTLGTTYYYRVSAVSATSTSSESNVINVVTVSPIKTTLNTTSCNSTLANIYSSINANYPIAGVTGYRFEITDTTNPSNPVQEIDRTVHWFTLTLLSNYNYATTYSIRVMLKVGAAWLGYYGDPCTVTTPSVAAAFGTSSLVSPACGSTLAAVSSSMNAKGISGATGYRFKVTRGTEEQTLDRIPQWFQLRQLTTYVYGATYSVEVAFKTTAGYGVFGPVCTIVSPIVPSITSCGTTVAASGQVTVPVLAGVTQYTYEVTGPSGVQLINRTTAHLPVNLITGYSTANTYSIRVAVMSTGVMSDFGAACSINPGSGARFGDSTSTPTITGTEFKAVGYPNPFETNFTLNVTTTSDENVQVAVYDMIGRQVDLKEVNTADANVLEVGSNYPSGVYNVVVSQGANVKSLRMIKR